MTVPGLLSQEDIARIEERASGAYWFPSRNRMPDGNETYLVHDCSLADVHALLAHIRAQDAYVAIVERLAKWWDGSDEPSEAAYELDEIAADAYERVRAVQSSENPRDIPKEAQ